MNLRTKRTNLTSFYSLLAISTLLFPLFVSCTSRQETLKKKLKKNPCLQINYWGDRWKQTTLIKRVKEAPPELIEKVHIEKEENNNVVDAIRFILLHELGHVLGVLTKAHSSWVEWYHKKKINMDHPFQKLSWRLTKDNKIVSLFDDEFPERRVVQVYSFEKSKLTNNQILPAYNNLIKHTNFPSLYATQSLWEDFAESFATYFHVIIDERPWQVIMQQDDGSKIVVESCWGDKRCEEKEIFMQKWFGNPQM